MSQSQNHSPPGTMLIVPCFHGYTILIILRWVGLYMTCSGNKGTQNAKLYIDSLIDVWTTGYWYHHLRNDQQYMISSYSVKKSGQSCHFFILSGNTGLSSLHTFFIWTYLARQQWSTDQNFAQYEDSLYILPIPPHDSKVTRCSIVSMATECGTCLADYQSNTSSVPSTEVSWGIHHPYWSSFGSPVKPVHISIGVAMTIIGIIAVCGNVFVLYVFLR